MTVLHLKCFEKLFESKFKELLRMASSEVMPVVFHCSLFILESSLGITFYMTFLFYLSVN